MKLSRDTFQVLRPQDLEDDGLDGVNPDDPNEYLSPFHQTKLGIWVYKMHGERWNLREIELGPHDLAQASAAERDRVADYYGIDHPFDSFLHPNAGMLYIRADHGAFTDYQYMWQYFDGMLYFRGQKSDGSFDGIQVCDIASERRSRGLPENVTFLEEIMQLHDSLNSVSFLELVNTKANPSQVHLRTGVFQNRGNK